MDDDRKPLLDDGETVPSVQNAPGTDSSPSSIINSKISGNATTDISEFSAPNMGPENAASKVTCRVCQEMIDVIGKKDQHVVKCNRCNEATPIRSAPPGKKYVRCLCHCLLICKSSSQRIACPRTNCKRVINLAPSPVTPPVPQVPGMCRVTCVNCQDTFLFNMLQNALARCPHCRKVSSVGPEFAKNKAIFFLATAVILFIVGIGFTFFTYRFTNITSYWLGIHIAMLMLILLAVWKSLYYCRIKVSSIDGPI